MSSPAKRHEVAAAGNPPPQQKAIDWRLITLFVVLMLIGLAFVLYASGSGSGFVYDDV